jgi:hypothetical protein
MASKFPNKASEFSVVEERRGTLSINTLAV